MYLTDVENQGKKVKVLLEVPVGVWAEVKGIATIRSRGARKLAVEILEWAIKHGYRTLSDKEREKGEEGIQKLRYDMRTEKK